jgi:hypothetical protein
MRFQKKPEKRLSAEKVKAIEERTRKNCEELFKIIISKNKEWYELKLK